MRPERSVVGWVFARNSAWPRIAAGDLQIRGMFGVSRKCTSPYSRESVGRQLSNLIHWVELSAAKTLFHTRGLGWLAYKKMGNMSVEEA
jgi:hypothetical protein